jgi:hypothetical protein
LRIQILSPAQSERHGVRGIVGPSDKVKEMLQHLTEPEVHAIIKEAAEYDRAHPTDALSDAITRLSDDARMELVALMWLGRGDAGDNFADHLKEARRNPHPVGYIWAKWPNLPRYLRDGLKKLS